MITSIMPLAAVHLILQRVLCESHPQQHTPCPVPVALPPNIDVIRFPFGIRSCVLRHVGKKVVNKATYVSLEVLVISGVLDCHHKMRGIFLTKRRDRVVTV